MFNDLFQKKKQPAPTQYSKAECLKFIEERATDDELQTLVQLFKRPKLRARALNYAKKKFSE